MPLVTCIMPTTGRRQFVPQAIRYFLAQEYAEKELVIVDDGTDSVADLVPENSSVRYFNSVKPQSVGAKRNFAAQQAAGEILVHWDDDDWSAPWRLRYQVEQLCGRKADICGLDHIWFYAPDEQCAWEYVYPRNDRPWVYGASLAYTRVFWEKHRFPDINVGEDTRFVWADARAKIHVLPDSRFLVGRIHAGNTSRKRTSDARYQSRPVEEIKRLLGDDFSFSTSLKERASMPGASLAASKRKPRALISAALGIGDILRVTPLIRVVHRLGYETDVLLVTDYPDVIELLEGAPEIRRVFHLPSPRRGTGPSQADGLTSQSYDLATFTLWSAPLRDRVRARSVHLFERRRWLVEGDTQCVRQIARELGWQGELPKPFAVASNRRFDLLPGTIAIHPGCKYEWPWKKWHGFDELARRFSNVVIVGAQEDVRTDNTYFRSAFAWPERALDFTGKLDLRDTAALLRECAALISNDSGLMHLGVALSVPTFAIFGITSPAREMIAAANMFPITKGLPCEPACRQRAWGRRDCEFHLRCLKTLTAEEVFMKVTATLPELQERSPSRTERPAALQVNGRSAASDTINLAYYGNVSDASGYGYAARAYIHALHAAGVNLCVIDLGASNRHLEDELVRSLVGRTIQPDFHLFHGIPPFWARQAFPLRNVIAMTVWETDAMPPQWRPILNHAIEVWLPCEFNISVFTRSLEKPVFKLPHPVFPPRAGCVDAGPFLRVDADQFIFYSIFEWQKRKCPQEMLEAFLRAFPSETDAALIVKTNPGAATAAGEAVAAARRLAPSAARIEIRAEGWSEAEIAALHDRADCYVSLHRGEGWGYPLFEAARRGKPIIATAYAGPLDYLNGESHELVRHTLCSVQQSYAYYHPAMRWAAPDSDHAVERMQWVHENRRAAQEKAGKAARTIEENFSLQSVGLLAYERLLHLLRRTNPEKARRLDGQSLAKSLTPPPPIPGEWFDADYFEHGLKSNWATGYHWKDFSGLFRETAEFLTALFPEAASFLDAGCAKGFLVRALRERGKEAWGFDHSLWAIEHAEELARPFLLHASAESAQFDRRFDVTLAFSLLENLTENQALEFLRRACRWTQHALVCVVITCEDDTARARIREKDHDLAHLTLQSREWWHERFLRAGWRQDALHRVAENACRTHPLPHRMGWEILVYAQPDLSIAAATRS
jgi:glycosyltransferase involved in cell wall biosynthesis/2-polyprenyl-3-methyl-5-hydroxy-6-metoxy-1,4-benzoquinol methylase